MADSICCERKPGVESLAMAAIKSQEKKTDWDRGTLMMASGALSTGGRNWRLPRKGEGGCQNITRLVGVKQRHSRSPVPERELSTLSIIDSFPFHVWRHKTAGDPQALLLNFLTSQTLGGRAFPRLRSFGHFFGNCVPVIKNIRPSYSGVNCEEHAGIAQFEDGERWINEIASTSRRDTRGVDCVCLVQRV